jgi:hypothetical protein
LGKIARNWNAERIVSFGFQGVQQYAEVFHHADFNTTGMTPNFDFLSIMKNIMSILKTPLNV